MYAPGLTARVKVSPLEPAELAADTITLKLPATVGVPGDHPPRRVEGQPGRQIGEPRRWSDSSVAATCVIERFAGVADAPALLDNTGAAAAAAAMEMVNRAGRDAASGVNGEACDVRARGGGRAGDPPVEELKPGRGADH